MTPAQQLPPPPDDLAADQGAAPVSVLPPGWEPMQPGELAELVVSGGSVREEDLPPAERADLERRRAARAGPQSPVAHDTLATLRRLLTKAETDGDIGPALKALEMMDRRQGAESAAQRPVADVLADMADVLREHGYTVAAPRA